MMLSAMKFSEGTNGCEQRKNLEKADGKFDISHTDPPRVQAIDKRDSNKTH